MGLIRWTKLANNERTTHGIKDMDNAYEKREDNACVVPTGQLAYFKDPAGAILQVSFIKTYGTSMGFNGIDENTTRVHQ